MIDYRVPGTNDLAKSSSFYDALLAEIGVGRMMDFRDLEGHTLDVFCYE